MSRNLSKEGFWGVPEKIKKLLGQDLAKPPRMFFIRTLSKENFEKIASSDEGVKIVLISIFP